MIIIFNIYDSSKTLGGSGGGGYREDYYPLWIYSSGSITLSYTYDGAFFLTKGSISGTTSSSNVSANLHALNSLWSTNQKFAFEASMHNGTSTSYMTLSALWDLTINSLVSASQIATNAISSTLVRSGLFTLIPGHNYGITAWNSGAVAYLTKAHLVAIMS